MEKVLITGAGGFIGKAVVAAALWNPDWEIHVVVSGKRDHFFPDGVCVHSANLSDADACERLMREAKPDILVHLAWDLGSCYITSDKNFLWVENSIRLLTLFSAQGGRKFVFASTGAVYGQGVGRFAETSVPIRRNMYASGKAAFEEIGATFSRYVQMEFVIARIFSVYGENDHKYYRAIPTAIRSFAKGEKFECRTPDNVWDFIHVEDVANALVRIAASDYCGTVNVGMGRPYLVRDVFTKIADKMGCLELLTFDESDKEPTILVADTTVLKRCIGYQCKVSFSEGLDRTIAWWKRYNESGE